MNIFKKSFLNLSLVIVGILVGTILQATDNNYISIKNNYKSTIRLVGVRSSGRIQMDLNSGETKLFHTEKNPIEFIRIAKPLPNTRIIGKEEIDKHPNEKLTVTISSDWFGNWKIEKNWKPSLSVDEFGDL